RDVFRDRRRSGHVERVAIDIAAAALKQHAERLRIALGGVSKEVNVLGRLCQHLSVAGPRAFDARTEYSVEEGLKFQKPFSGAFCDGIWVHRAHPASARRCARRGST